MFIAIAIRRYLGSAKSQRRHPPRRNSRIADATAIVAQDVAQVRELLAVLETNPTRGRELLSRLVSPIVMSPFVASSGHREYRATGAFKLGYFVGLGADQVADKGGCAGAQ